MKKTDSAVRLLLSEIENKDILEAACGTGEFSNSASAFARSVSCIDLIDSKLTTLKRANIYFRIMNAADMDYPKETFDAVFLYNAMSHISSRWEAVKKECLRVLKPKGSIYIIGTWKIDTALIKEMFGGSAEQKGGFLIVKIANQEENQTVWRNPK